MILEPTREEGIDWGPTPCLTDTERTLKLTNDSHASEQVTSMYGSWMLRGTNVTRMLRQNRQERSVQKLLETIRSRAGND